MRGEPWGYEKDPRVLAVTLGVRTGPQGYGRNRRGEGGTQGCGRDAGDTEETPG